MIPLCLNWSYAAPYPGTYPPRPYWCISFSNHKQGHQKQQTTMVIAIWCVPVFGFFVSSYLVILPNWILHTPNCYSDLKSAKGLDGNCYMGNQKGMSWIHLSEAEAWLSATDGNCFLFVNHVNSPATITPSVIFTFSIMYHRQLVECLDEIIHPSYIARCVFAKIEIRPSLLRSWSHVWLFCVNKQLCIVGYC